MDTLEKDCSTCKFHFLMPFGDNCVKCTQERSASDKNPRWTSCFEEGITAALDVFPAAGTPKLTGGSSDYYKVKITNPTSDRDAYTAECNDIIEALDMNFAEGNAFKALWRMAAARKGNGKPGTTALYDAEKVVFFGERLVSQNKGGDA